MKLKNGWLRRWLVPTLLLFVTLFSLFQARQQSLTTDEGIHVASAYLALTRGDHRFDPEHPFLFKYLTALPLLPFSLNLPPDDQELWEASQPTFYDSWQEARTWSDQWFYASGNNPVLMTFLARLPGVAVLVFFCWLLFYCARIWFGERVARWTLFFAAFSPVFLAHGPTTNTDVPLAATTLLATLWLWRYFEQPTWRRALLVGVGLALALTVKYSAVVLLPVALVWLILTASRGRVRWVHALGHLFLALMVIWGSIWIVYFFQSPVHLETPTEQAQFAKARDYLLNQGLDPIAIVETARNVLPSAYLKGFVITGGASTYGRVAWIVGTWYPAGQWFYFPLSLVLKTQLVVVSLLALGVGLTLRSWGRPRSWKPEIVLLVMTAGVIALVALTSKLNLGIRHISGLFPFMFLLLGLTAAKLRTFFPGLTFLLIVGLGTALPVFSQQSNLIGFMNLLTLPRQTQWHYFVDSNLEWGNQTERVARYIAKEFDGQRVYVNYPWNPSYVFAAFGTSVASFDPRNIPTEGILVITAAHLPKDEYEIFRQHEPLQVLGNHTFFYDASSLRP